MCVRVYVCVCCGSGGGMNRPDPPTRGQRSNFHLTQFIHVSLALARKAGRNSEHLFRPLVGAWENVEADYGVGLSPSSGHNPAVSGP